MKSPRELKNLFQANVIITLQPPDGFKNKM
jgi:hypothetical protein